MVFFLKIFGLLPGEAELANFLIPSNSGSALPRGISLTPKKINTARTIPSEPVM
jgi:hypothetical protein